jgi:hypothetical protein
MLLHDVLHDIKLVKSYRIKCLIIFQIVHHGGDVHRGPSNAPEEPMQEPEQKVCQPLNGVRYDFYNFNPAAPEHKAQRFTTWIVSSRRLQFGFALSRGLYIAGSCEKPTSQ